MARLVRAICRGTCG